MPLLELLLASQLVLAAADKAPAFNVEPTCRDSMTDTLETLQSCMNDEKTAQQQLNSQWGKFANEDRTMCTDLVQHYDPSYVELLSCLEMMRDAKAPPPGQDANLPATSPDVPPVTSEPGTVGSGATGR